MQDILARSTSILEYERPHSLVLILNHMHHSSPKIQETASYQTVRSDVNAEDRLFCRINATRRDHGRFPRFVECGASSIAAIAWC